MGAMEVVSSTLGEGAGIGRGAMGGLAATATGITLALKSFTTIPEGSVGVKTRFGKVRRDQEGAPIIKQAGARLTFPGVHAYKLINTRMRSNDLENTSVEMISQSGLPEKRSLSASILWFVSKEDDAPYRALFEVEEADLTQLATNTCLSALRSTVHRKNLSVLDDADALYENTKVGCQNWYDHAGLVLAALNVKDVTPSEAQVLASAFPDNDNPSNKSMLSAVHTHIQQGEAESA